MNYREFLDFIKNSVQDMMGSSFAVELHQVTKINGLVLDGLIITKKDAELCPTIYLNQYFQQYEDGLKAEEITAEICNSYMSEYKNIPKSLFSDVATFEKIQGRVVYKLICRQRNGKLLSDVPFTPYLNLAMVYYLLISKEENSQITSLIHNKHLELWGVTKEEIHNLAKVNTESLLPAAITTMRDTMHKIIKESMDNEIDAEKLCEIMDEEEQESEHSLYVLSNTTGQNGAACILYEEVLKNFSKAMESDIIILPSSIHEVLLMPNTGKLEPYELHEMVHSINCTIPVEEVLSDQVYIFRRETGEIQLLK